MLSLQYHQPIGSNVSLYAGGGVARLLFLNEKDGAIAEFDVRDTWAPALQVGTRVALNSSLLLNLDTRYIPFNGNISGNLGPARVKAKVGGTDRCLSVPAIEFAVPGMRIRSVVRSDRQGQY